MEFSLSEELKHFEEVFHTVTRTYYDEITSDDHYIMDPNEPQTESYAIIITKKMAVKEFLKCIITFPQGGGYDVDFIYQKDENPPGITKDHLASRDGLLEAWMRFLKLHTN